MDARERMQELRQDAAILAKPVDPANQDGELSRVKRPAAGQAA